MSARPDHPSQRGFTLIELMLGTVGPTHSRHFRGKSVNTRSYVRWAGAAWGAFISPGTPSSAVKSP